MKVVGHRGAAGLAPENSLKAISLACGMGVDAVEFDVRVTKDRKLILMHDDDLVKCCGVNKKIKEMSLSQILKIPTLSGEPIPRLEEALEIVDGKTVFLEPKDSDIYHELIAITKGSSADIRYTTREHTLLAEIKHHNPELKIYPTNDWVWYSLKKQIRKLRADGLSINYGLLNPLTLWMVKRLNVEMLIFTVDDATQIEKAKNLFSDVWLCTNRPDIALAIKNA